MAHTASTDRRWRGCYPVVVRCAGAGAAQPRLFTPGWCRHCTASRWSLHWSRHSSATHNTLPSHIIHPYRRKHCTADMHKIAVGAVHLGVIYSPPVTRTPLHIHITVVTPASALRDPGRWMVDGGHRLEQEIHRAVIICQHANSTLTQLSRLYLIINFIWSGLWRSICQNFTLTNWLKLNLFIIWKLEGIELNLRK